MLLVLGTPCRGWKHPPRPVGVDKPTTSMACIGKELWFSNRGQRCHSCSIRRLTDSSLSRATTANKPWRKLYHRETPQNTVALLFSDGPSSTYFTPLPVVRKSFLAAKVPLPVRRYFHCGVFA